LREKGKVSDANRKITTDVSDIEEICAMINTSSDKDFLSLMRCFRRK
jgi:hypothetical protein